MSLPIVFAYLSLCRPVFVRLFAYNSRTGGGLSPNFQGII